MWNAAHVREMVRDAHHYCLNVDASNLKVDWPKLKLARDDYIKRLNGIYAKNLGNSEVALIEGVSWSWTRALVKSCRKE